MLHLSHDLTPCSCFEQKKIKCHNKHIDLERQKLYNSCHHRFDKFDETFHHKCHCNKKHHYHSFKKHHKNHKSETDINVIVVNENVNVLANVPITLPPRGGAALLRDAALPNNAAPANAPSYKSYSSKKKLDVIVVNENINVLANVPITVPLSSDVAQPQNAALPDVAALRNPALGNNASSFKKNGSKKKLDVIVVNENINVLANVPITLPQPGVAAPLQNAAQVPNAAPANAPSSKKYSSKKKLDVIVVNENINVLANVPIDVPLSSDLASAQNAALPDVAALRNPALANNALGSKNNVSEKKLDVIVVNENVNVLANVPITVGDGLASGAAPADNAAPANNAAPAKNNVSEKKLDVIVVNENINVLANVPVTV